MGRKLTVATCALNQWAMDFEGNLRRILKTCQIAKDKGAAYRLGPELEIPGYGCADHFLENDTIQHSFEVLAELMTAPETQDLLCDVGMPVMHKGARYNCRVIFHNKRVILMRPKLILAMDRNYREGRWFTPWKRRKEVEEFILPEIISSICGQTTVPFGDAVISTVDTCIGSEICEELFSSDSPHVSMAIDGVEVVTNGSGSHHELRKLYQRVNLIQAATKKCGGVYLYSNLLGCDGDRVYYDGCCMVSLNGEFLAQGSQFTLQEVEVTVATIDLDDITSYRGAMGTRRAQSQQTPCYPRCFIHMRLCRQTNPLDFPTTHTIQIHYFMPEEEISLGPPCWLWDYLRRSRMAGFFLPLSGGLDSSSTACIVGCMCQQVLQACHDNNGQVIEDVRAVLRLKDSDPIPATAKELASKLFTTCYLSSPNSSTDTRLRAERLAEQIGSNHYTAPIDNVFQSSVNVFQQVSNCVPHFSAHGGTPTENLALQNLQARSRMLLSYLFAQLTPWSKNVSSCLLVLGSANVDESLYGYLTKYDCSSADINPIGSISKRDLRNFCRYMACTYPELNNVISARPTAELEPITESHYQTDEEDMGMSYDELSDIGRLRKEQLCGPYTMFIKLIDLWRAHHTPREVAAKVKRFFRSYSSNRHKMTTLTPSYHTEVYSPDDNRHDLRQFLYNTQWTWQFRAIDKELAVIEGRDTKGQQTADSSSSDGFITAQPKTATLTSLQLTESGDGFITAQPKTATWTSLQLTESPHPTAVSTITGATQSPHPTSVGTAGRKRPLTEDTSHSDKRHCPPTSEKEPTSSPAGWLGRIINRK